MDNYLDKKPPPSIKGYTLLKLLGEGGMGSVYEATRNSDKLELAVKIIHPDESSDNNLLRRFFREIKICARFAHPYVIKIIDCGQTGPSSTPFLVMERLHGTSLNTVCSEKPCPEKQAFRIAECMAEALSYIHAHGIVHRDIKPANIFLENSGRVVLLDFGLARGWDYTKNIKLMTYPKRTKKEQRREDS